MNIQEYLRMALSHLIALLLSLAHSLPSPNNSVSTHPLLLHNLAHLDKEEVEDCIREEEVVDCWLADISLDALEAEGITLPDGEHLEVVKEI